MTGRCPQATVLLELAYDGRYFHGLQVQPALKTVSGELQRRIQTVFGEAPRALSFAARTDAGVSALQNFATFRCQKSANLERQLRDLLGTSDEALKLITTEQVSRSVNARNCARNKHYRYEIAVRALPPVPNAWNMHPVLDLQAMQRAAQLLLGEHDFSAFRAPGCGAKNPVKQLTRIDVSEGHSGQHISETHHATDTTAAVQRIRTEIEGDAFLRKMVRILCGTLAEVGAGLRTPSSMQQILESRKRANAGITAPARGLTLVRVNLE